MCGHNALRNGELQRNGKEPGRVIEFASKEETALAMVATARWLPVLVRSFEKGVRGLGLTITVRSHFIDQDGKACPTLVVRSERLTFRLGVRNAREDFLTVDRPLTTPDLAHPCSQRLHHSPLRRQRQLARGTLMWKVMIGTAVALICAMGTGLQAQRHQPLVLKGATLIDGSDLSPRRGWTVVIDGDRIADLYPDGMKPTHGDAKIMDLAGRYVIPGLIDTHVHVATDPKGRDANAAEQLRGALLGGVTSVRDMAGDAIVLRDLARAAENGSVASPRVYFAAVIGGPTFFEDPRTRSAAHGGTPGDVAWLRAITPEADVASVVSAAKSTGASGLKLYADLPPRTVEALAKEAHKQGMKVWSHATIFPSRPSDAVSGGVDAVSHAILLYWEGGSSVPDRYHARETRAVYDSVDAKGAAICSLFAEMKKRGTVLDATLFISSRLESAPPGTGGMVDPKRAVQWMYDATRQANELGVAVAGGTDGMMPGSLAELPNIHREMELLVTRAGFTPAQAITAATLNSARAIGIEREVGTIAIGKAADLVVLEANPLEDIRHTRRIELVVKRGTIHRRQAPR
jgi:imidazolonepropionase-like amidohydrolase